MKNSTSKPLKHTDLNDVRLFVAAAEAPTMTAAAAELCVPTSTISRAITRLEKRLEVKLTQRGARGFAITDVGRGYLDACRKALRALDEGESWIEAQRSEPGGTLKVACTVTFARDILAPLLKEFLHRFPHLRVELDTYASGSRIAPSDDTDVFFEVRQTRESPRNIRSYPGLALGLFASHDYIRTMGVPATPAELAAHSCVGAGSWRLSRGENIEAVRVAFTVETSDPMSQMKLVQSGLGIGVLPLLWAAQHIQGKAKLVSILPDWEFAPMSFCALFFGRKRQTPKVQALLDFLQEFIGTPKDPRLRVPWDEKFFPGGPGTKA
jgi:LysR family transcriptional activator of dmlA